VTRVAEIGAVISRGFWSHDYGSRDANRSAVIGRSVDGEVLKEDFTDHCIGQVLGTTSVRQPYPYAPTT